MSNLEKLKQSLRAGHYLTRWLNIQAELFTPKMDPERRRRINAILDRLARRHDELTPWDNKLLAGRKS